VTRPVLISLGIASGLAAWWFLGDDEPGGALGDARQVFRDAIYGITQGVRLTRAPYSKDTGVVPGRPEDLAAQAGLDLDTYALARMIASEEGGSSAAAQALVAHAAKNAAAASGRSVAQQLLRANNADHAGKFGTQADLETWVTNASGKLVHPSDRYASTAIDPYAGHAAVAAGVLSGDIPDLTNGATQFDRPSGEADPDRVAAKRTAAGSVEVAGLDEFVGDDLRFWGLPS